MLAENFSFGLVQSITAGSHSQFLWMAVSADKVMKSEF